MLEDVSLALGEGEFVAVAGPNGGGKTTLMRILLGLERPAAGSAILYGEPAHRFSGRRALGYLAQRSQLGGDAPATVREVVAAGASQQGACWGGSTRKTASTSRRRSPGRTLCGRRAVAHALRRDAAAHVHREGARGPAAPRSRRADNGVDAESQESLAELLATLHRELGVTIVYVSHEFGAVERHVERLVLVRRTIVFDGSPGELPGMWHDPGHVHARE